MVPSNGLLFDFVTTFSSLCLGMGLVVIIAMWIGIKIHIANSRNPQVKIGLAYGVAVSVAGFYGLLIFSPIFEWVGNWSVGLGLAWFILANPIWLFIASLYFNRSYKIAMNNLH